MSQKYKSGNRLTSSNTTRVQQVSRGGGFRSSQPVEEQSVKPTFTSQSGEESYTRTQNKQVYMEEGSETTVIRRKIVTTTTTSGRGQNSQLPAGTTSSPSNKAYGTTVSQISKGLQGSRTSTKPKPQALPSSSSSRKPDPVVRNRGTSNPVQTRKPATQGTKKLRPSISDAKFFRKAVNRGGDYDNILITHVVYTTDPNTEFHITDPLDTSFVDNELLDIKRLKTNKRFFDPNTARTTFTSSVENWQPKPKETGLNKSTVYEHVNGKTTTNRPLDSSVGKVRSTKAYNKTSTTSTRGPASTSRSSYKKNY